jgi:hypothetical protein
MTHEEDRTTNEGELSADVAALLLTAVERSKPRTAAEGKVKPQRNKEGKDPLPLAPKRLGITTLQRPGRALVAAARLRARVQLEAITECGRQGIEKQVSVEVDFDDPEWVEREVNRRLEELASYSHPRTAEYVTAFGPNPQCRSQRPATCNDVIELQVMRELPQVQRLEQHLRERNDGLGRPSDRLLATSTFMTLGFTGRDKTLKPTYEALTSSDQLLDQAVGHPLADTENCRAYNSVTTSLGRQLNHHDPDFLVELNGEFLRDRRAEFGEDYGKRVVLDGMKWEAHLLQQGGVSDVENELLKRGFTRAEFGYHGPGEGWRGFMLLVLRDLHSLDILGWMLAPANEREHGFVEALLLRVFEHFPEWQPEALIADREYDIDRLYRNLLERFGIHLICPLREPLDEKYKLGKQEGVPECSNHGLMKRVRDREFPHQELRQQLGLEVGQPASVERARTEWKCTECPAREVTYFKVNPRIFGYHPRRGSHKLVGQREAMQVLRNVAESTNASLQYRKFGLKGQSRAKWVSTDREAEWLAGAGLLAMNMRQLIHGADGPYDRAHKQAEADGLLKPRRATPGELRLIQGGAAAATRSEAA